MTVDVDVLLAERDHLLVELDEVRQELLRKSAELAELHALKAAVLWTEHQR